MNKQLYVAQNTLQVFDVHLTGGSYCSSGMLELCSQLQPTDWHDCGLHSCYIAS